MLRPQRCTVKGARRLGMIVKLRWKRTGLYG
nr:MAG TPA: hypothetical protein [Caudoviricetes sp.]